MLFIKPLPHPVTFTCAGGDEQITYWDMFDRPPTHGVLCYWCELWGPVTSRLAKASVDKLIKGVFDDRD